MRRSASGNGHISTMPVPLEDQELFQVPMETTGSGIGEIDHASQVVSELVETPTEA
jgi:hypothetical protein